MEATMPLPPGFCNEESEELLRRTHPSSHCRRVLPLFRKTGGLSVATLVSFILLFFQTESDNRKSLYKLRTTWSPFLSKQKLAAIDKHVHALDPNWPVLAVDKDPPGTTIFVNPVFIGVRLKMFCGCCDLFPL